MDTAALSSRLDAVLADPDLAANVGAIVLDGASGRQLFARSATIGHIPASTMKVVSALSIVDTLDPAATMATTVVAGKSSSQIVLVAGGDTMLGRGDGNTTATLGRAGLGDLANQVAANLGDTKKVSLRLDLSYAAGPNWPATWNRADLDSGVTQTVRMIGLADQRPDAAAGKVSPPDPPSEVAKAFAAALADEGIAAELTPESTWQTPAPSGAGALGVVHSAPYADVLSLALLESDNALMENLARQASVAAGGKPTEAGVVAHTRVVLASHAIPTTGMVLRDASGLSHGQLVPPQTIAHVIRVGSSGQVPGMSDVIAGLPIAGLTGTLDAAHERFDGPTTKAVAGVPRAKTGTLIGTSALAGTTVSADGHLFVFAVLADGVPATAAGTRGARAALDRFAAALTTCGCTTTASASPTPTPSGGKTTGPGTMDRGGPGSATGSS